MADQENSDTDVDADAQDHEPEANDNDKDQEIPEDMMLISKDKYRKMQSERDSSLNNSEDLESELDEVRQERERDKQISRFLRDNSDDYPDVQEEDLESATTKEEIKELAEKTQERFKVAEERALQKLQEVPSAPQMSKEDKEQKVQELIKRAEKGEDVFDEWLELTD